MKTIILGMDGACPDIIETEIAAGRLPNFRRLKEQGCSADLLPYHSSVTPGNWTSIATGAKPWTIGISDFCMHEPGTPLDKRVHVFSKTINHRAEFVWDALSDRGHRAATISYVAGLPKTSPRHTAFGNDGSPGEGPAPWTIAGDRALTAGGVNPVGPYNWNEHESVEWAAVTDPVDVAGVEAQKEFLFSVEGEASRGYGGRHTFRMVLGTQAGEPVCVWLDGTRTLVLKQNKWSPFIEKPFSRDNDRLFRDWRERPGDGTTVTGEFRMRVTHMDPERGELLLYISEIYPKTDFATDLELAQAFRERFGPYSDSLPMSRYIMGWLDEEALLDTYRAQGLWQAKAALALIREHGFSMVLCKWHSFDKFYHFCLGKIDPVSPHYAPEEAEALERIHRGILAVADEMVGLVLDELPDDANMAVLSDHGLMASRRCLWVNRLLAKHGYLHAEPGEGGRPVIDWSRTRAYVSAYMLLNLNVKGRDPDGIVEPGKEYETVREEILELLRGWKDPENGVHVLSDVFATALDGACYGLPATEHGDIRYFCRPGYTLFRSTSPLGEELVTDVRSHYLGDHGSCRPTTRYGRGGETAIFYAAGRGFRRGAGSPYPVTVCDVMPTLLYAAGQAPLRHQEGAVLHHLLTRES